MVARVLAGLALIGCLAGAHAQPVKVHRVGFVIPTAGIPSAFREELQRLGYIEGHNLVFESRFAEGRQERLPGMVAELLGRRVDVLVVISTAGALAAKRTTSTVPVVFASVFDPVASGIVPRLARPGGNITGAALGAGGSGFAAKWLELVKEVIPGASRVAILCNPLNPAGMRAVRELATAAELLGVRVDVLEAANGPAVDSALAAIGAGAAQAMIVTNDPLFTRSRGKLVAFAAAKRLPAVYFFGSFAHAGGLIAYGPSQDESFRRAATQVDKILRGAQPGDLPIEQSTRFELIVNLRAAKALGLAIPRSLLVRADHVIQ